jgi:hypothetical protein
MRRPTAKELAFAKATVDGSPPSQAYRIAYHTQKCSAHVVSVAAQGILNRPVVVAEIARLRALAETPKTLSRQRKRELLAKQIEDEITQKGQALAAADIHRALEIDNRMAGHNEPDPIKIEGLGSLLQKIRKEAKKP